MRQEEIDARNAQYWDELCGSSLARSLGITDISPESLDKFDKAYLAIYPYLAPYVTREPLADRKVLEIGLGYGTLGQLIVSRTQYYHGLDIAPGPVAMMQYRLGQLGQDGTDRVRVGSALDIPYEDGTFDYVYSIGCLHHTGDLPRAISEVHRVLAPGGKSVIMLYNRHSFRQLVQVPLMRVLTTLSGKGRYSSFAERVRALYDANADGAAAPHTDYVSRSQVRTLFAQFSSIRVDRQNFDTYVLLRGRLIILRERLLNNVARVAGLDLYIVAEK